MYYIVGLGNPGEQYALTRHNVGRTLLEQMVSSQRQSWRLQKPAKALVAVGSLASSAVAFVLPETFMNNSGEACRYFHTKEAVETTSFVVVYDDVDLSFGEVKVSVGRGDGGHNGIKSIIGALQTKNFVRVRVGVAHKSFWTGKATRPQGDKLSRHVLGRFSGSEQRALPELASQVESVLTTIVTDGVERAMNQYN